MSLFNKVFTGSEADEEAPATEQSVRGDSSTTDHQVETVSALPSPDSPFAAFVKEAVRFGATSEAPPTPESVEETSEEDDVEVDEEVDNSDELDEDDESEEDEDDEDYSSDEDDDEDDEDDEDSSEVAEAEASVAPMADAATPPTPQPAAERPTQKIEESAPVAQAPAPLAPRVETPATPVPVKTQQQQKKQKKQPVSQEEQARLIIEGLFDKMRGAWEKEQSPSASTLAAQKLEEQRRAEQLLQLEQHALTESKAEITKMLGTQIPRVVEGKLLASIKAEVTKAVRSAVTKALHDEFDSVERAMARQLERLHAIEARMSKIEGALDREVQINFPKGAIQVDSPITVQPPSVTFSEGAISAHFNKTGGGKKEVHFERDPHDQSIKSATIDAPSE